MFVQGLNSITRSINETGAIKNLNPKRLVAVDLELRSVQGVERFVVYPLANLAATRQLRLGDVVILELDSSGNKLACF